ncbi:hypothetical protein BD309DRAFT_961584 [Dichomitus squalens]|nr:hypothetical protein BD309DRAFT_961584 [Dichomitus squalens]
MVHNRLSGHPRGRRRPFFLSISLHICSVFDTTTATPWSPTGQPLLDPPYPGSRPLSPSYSSLLLFFALSVIIPVPCGHFAAYLCTLLVAPWRRGVAVHL